MIGFQPPLGGFSVTFFTDYTNLVLIAIALISGVLLLWPVLRRGSGISASDAILLINRRNALIVDVRTATEFAGGHLPQARHIALEELTAKAAQVSKNKKTPLLLVCQSGQRAQKAQAVLAGAGYAEIHVLQGGLAAWQQAGLPVVKPAVAAAKQVAQNVADKEGVAP
jgi:rhodanese-related sulfurtransferase